MDDFISSENLTQLSSPIGTGVEQLKRSAVDGFVATQNVGCLRRQLETSLTSSRAPHCSNCCCMRRKSPV